MKLDRLRRRLQALEPGPSAHDDWDNWVEIRLAIVYALDDFPDAKMAVVAGIQADPTRRDTKWPDDWPALRVLILDSLQPFQPARERVLAALKEVGA